MACSLCSCVKNEVEGNENDFINEMDMNRSYSTTEREKVMKNSAILSELDTISNSYEKSEYTNINGFDYPSDAYELFERYPNGFGDYVWFLPPQSDNWEGIVEEYRNSYFYLKVDFESYADDLKLKGNEGYPFEFYPEKDGLVPWAQCDNGTVLYFICDDTSSKVVVYGDGYEFYEYPLSITEYLYKLINGEIDCFAYLPTDLFEEEVVFN